MKPAQIRSFITSLQRDTRRLDQLAVLLQQQHEMMSCRQSLQLEQVNRQALELMQQVNESHDQREQFLQQLGLSPDKSGIQTLISRLPVSLRQGVKTLLDELAVRSRVCHSLNEKSGQLLASQRQLMQKLTGMRSQTSYPQLPVQARG